MLKGPRKPKKPKLPGIDSVQGADFEAFRGQGRPKPLKNMPVNTDPSNTDLFSESKDKFKKIKQLIRGK